MRYLNVTGVEDGVILASDANGDEYRIAVDDMTLSRLRRPSAAAPEARVSPRDIQTQLRAGLTREEVAELTGASLDDVARFEGPVLAELEHVINSALALPAFSQDSQGVDRSVTVGARVRTQIDNAGGTDERWASWRNPEGEWHVKCTFRAGGVEHEGRWSFEPKHHLLTPLNDEAANLLADQAFTSGLIPRLRAVDGKPRRNTGATKRLTDVAPSTPDVSAPETVAEAVSDAVAGIITEAVVESIDIVAHAVHDHDAVAHSYAEDAVDVPPAAQAEAAPTPTADLMAALRKRRSENQDAPAWLADAASGEAAQSKPASITDELAEMQNNSTGKTSRTGSSRRNRAQMPTWDEIVFGTKVDDDLI